MWISLALLARWTSSEIARTFFKRLPHIAAARAVVLVPSGISVFMGVHMLLSSLASTLSGGWKGRFAYSFVYGEVEWLLIAGFLLVFFGFFLFYLGSSVRYVRL